MSWDALHRIRLPSTKPQHSVEKVLLEESKELKDEKKNTKSLFRHQIQVHKRT